MVRPVKAHKTVLATRGLLFDRKLTTISVSNPTNNIWTGEVFRSLAPRLPPVMDVRKVEKMGSKMRFAKSKPPPHRTTMFVRGSMSVPNRLGIGLTLPHVCHVASSGCGTYGGRGGYLISTGTGRCFGGTA